MIRTAVPGGSSIESAEPAAISPMMGSGTGASCVAPRVSAARTA